MAEPIPHNLGDEDQRRARELYGRNMFICGLLLGGFVGAGFALSFASGHTSEVFFGIAFLLMMGWFLLSRRDN